MRDNSKRALGVAALTIVAMIAYRLLFPPLPSDHQQILTDIQSAVQAVEARNLGGVMAIISDHYVDDNGLTNEALRVYLARAIRETRSVTIDAPLSVISVNGNLATSSTQISVNADTESGSWARPRREVILTWKRERVNRFLFIPDKQWRITSATYGGLDSE